jgi:hypothetical protein
MKGHTIRIAANQFPEAIDIEGTGVFTGGSLPERGRVIVKNGTLSGFPYGLRAIWANNVTISNMTISSIPWGGYGRALQLSNCQKSTVEDCFFTGLTDYAIVEFSDVSPAHNSFINMKFGNEVAQEVLIQYGSSNPAPSVISKIDN